ncbi:MULTISPECIES: 3-(cis-5,6-dihydroxycyclohexa-1,3-dien-1-yl)propanoate dehydrogenase [unclassified Burkholderia]|uniref:3-(cis-5,6-dihydroxycyclohexa-1, 3-dien-1-yl)propanoate dehydrogenase n=1 Tax=unclassified Burkholderia TaxID=2613784 RepID=UPI000F5889E1|nr:MULTISPECIES: 3-(cis-5,6-dihydroxycyclohexa-1,3-dien-1-yl)propanoate dehydrogenase [unclassified Burkholderia]RQR68769.1 3-(cis-5,6-dihydroxycyclohexa-1,3-dien-1-yl)propanoate dehydrogenase [Burkholderia sp. Bp9012]RQR70276.1 3-(cis-5,6-dihydroxycyclohexa-1,3-dien-1-yl)propanoate dehydrogenase [Burkholderia sp. Bp9011]RQR83022.1 3-(cis-5,6-dihydroxycyclohexa-1,3-dien-1-yl)propanoate dehydrogenase [Burkholderia sp. Bp9010]RQZ39431.1 3-(cis-5,6-dihydroxycyclohexa-1,3-dien-1-yl)propanoate dehyd
MGWLNDDVALITGASSGIGLAVVRRFLAEGAAGIGVLIRSAAHADMMHDEFGDRIAITVGDVRSPEANAQAVDATVRAFGKLDTLVANAGVWDHFASLRKFDGVTLKATFEEVFAVNVLGYMLAAQSAAPALRDTRGSMIFTLSNASFYAGGGGPVYVASKHACVGLIKQLAWELAPDVRVNGVAPGGTVTPLKGPQALGRENDRLSDIPGFADAVADAMPLGFIAQPEDHTGHYVLLASRTDSPATTAAILQSDGGWEIRGPAARRKVP